MPQAAMLDARTARVLPWLVAIAFFMQTLDGTILNTALPSMARDLAEDPLRMQGVVIAYMLTVALLIPASGWLADRFGTRRIFFSALMLFTLGSLLCAMSTSFNQLVVARVVQGVGGALMLPGGRLVVLRAYPRSEFVRVMTFIALPGMVGPLIGPTLGGWLVEYHWPGVALVVAACWFFRAPSEGRAWLCVLPLLALYLLNGTAWHLLAVPLLLAFAWWAPDVDRNRWAFWAYYPGHLAVLALLVAA